MSYIEPCRYCGGSGRDPWAQQACPKCKVGRLMSSHWEAVNSEMTPEQRGALLGQIYAKAPR